MKLYLVRHATATERLGGSVRTDADRPLVAEGRQEAELVAKLLKRMGVNPDAYLTSPLVRARQTAEIFAEVLGGKDKLKLCQALAPAGRFGELCRDIKDLRHTGEVFLFGHMPDISQLACTLLACDMDMPFKKSAVCRIDVYDLPPTSGGQLKWMITPRLAEAASK